MVDRGRLPPALHRALWIAIRTTALLLVSVGLITAATADHGAFRLAHGIGILLAVLGWYLESHHVAWLRDRFPPRCPACGGVMDTAHRLWEAPDDSPQRYVEYSCRSCPRRITHDFVGKAIYGWPPREPYVPPERTPFTLMDGIKTVLALIALIGLVALLNWTGRIGSGQ